MRDMYGITPDEKLAMIARQDGRCLICHGEITGPAAHVDHKHGLHGPQSIRGILCGACNIGLGYFRDSPESLRRAADYLEAYEARRARHQDDEI